MKASGDAETIVAELPTGGGHWTRDLEFSPDGKTLLRLGRLRLERRRGTMEADAPEGFIDEPSARRDLGR